MCQFWELLGRYREKRSGFDGPALVVRYLYEERGICASGHDTIDTDPGSSTSRNESPLEAYILARDRWQIEMLANLDLVPETGSLVVVTWPKAKEGSGFPARVFAITPPGHACPAA